MKNLKFLFNIILSLSLVMTPFYSYSEMPSSEGNTTGPESLVQMLIDNNANTQMPEEFQEASRIFIEMGDAVEKGKLQEYLDSHPELVNHFDILSLRNQKAGIINAQSGETGPSIDFNTYIHHSYPTLISNIEVGFTDSEGSKSVLTFKGVVVQGDETRKKQIGVHHYFKDIEEKDIIDWVYDKEMLVLLHKEKGLILYHTVLAKALLGEAPIPSIIIPMSSNLLKNPNLKIEFIDRSIEPPEKPSRSSKQVPFNTAKDPLYSAGDLLISSTDDQGIKKIKHVLSRREDLYRALFRHYVILDFLIQTTTLQIQDKKDAQDSALNIYYLQENTAFSLLSSALNRESILFLKDLSNNILGAKAFLLFPKDKDLFSQSEWMQDYEKLKQNIADRMWDGNRRSSGDVISSSDIASFLSKGVKIEESKKPDGVLKKWKNSYLEKLKNKYPKGYTILSQVYEGKLAVVAALSAGAWAIMYAGSIPSGEDASYLKYVTYNIVLYGVGILALIGALSHRSIWMLKKLERLLPDGEFKIKVNQTIEKWKDQSTASRLVGLDLNWLPLYFIRSG